MKVAALAARSGRWWAVEVPGVDGAFTQVRRLRDVAEAVQQVVSLLEGIAESAVDVDVTVVVPDAIAQELDAVAADRRQADLLARDATARMARAARELAGDGLTTRDVGQVLGVSHQRVAQLLHAAEPAVRVTTADDSGPRRYVAASARRAVRRPH